MQRFLIPVALCILLPACTESRKSPHESVSADHVKVTYGRPYKKGRIIFGGLLKYGSVWRTGADEATEIQFDKDGVFGGKPVKAGTYTLYTVPNEKEWEVILNGQTGQWGTEYNKSKDIFRVVEPVTTLDEPVEQFTIRFDNNKMIMEWDKTRVSVPLNF